MKLAIYIATVVASAVTTDDYQVPYQKPVVGFTFDDNERSEVVKATDYLKAPMIRHAVVQDKDGSDIFGNADKDVDSVWNDVLKIMNQSNLRGLSH
ncbi:MAG: uncharacterized protein KVP18_004047 [Porospora cf. gigantea A]|uniref:uncharacterized protein n=1 Tax=Porospora cf. gigantea A TaxID=2853593 RepID=UPI00355A8616|nr:MAG: hypothetical protein KVP18_004047 [Porospora cf. gigantea A]